MPEYDITTGTKILGIAIVIQLIAFCIALFFENTGTFAILTGAGMLCLLVATYSAATDRTMKVFHQGGMFGKLSTSEASTAFMFSIFSLMFNAILVIIFLLAGISDLNIILIILFTLIGGVFIVIGGYAGNKEWHGDTLSEGIADFKEYLERRRHRRRFRRH